MVTPCGAGRRVFLSARTERNQWPRPPSLAPSGQFTSRCAKGCVSDERLRGAGAQSRPTPWTPICVGRLTGSLVLSSGGHRRRKVRSIPNAQAWASVMPLPCSSSPHQTRFAGLWRGSRWTIWYFLPRGPRLSVCAARTPSALVKPGRPLLLIRRV